ncbi:transcription initiation factor TFIID subunit taf73 [Ditylenchus destructor]|uniref:Transcription initiation factor TFIID subunit taf73 n=1 Tax=Ditylenchus destructor TaxID=166010 RepID=A0AAD4N4S1_9BILA|nr:transcription initiation factor TFIID subunit taf73 [Ditylenchus destructor]
MYMKKKRRKLERLVEKYTEQRDIQCSHKDNEEDEENNYDLCPSTSATNFTPPIVPGVFPAESLLEAFELLQKHFPELAPAVYPLIRSHLPANLVPDFAKIKRENAEENGVINSVEQWTNIKNRVESICPLMLPFVAQLVQVSTSPNLVAEKIPMEQQNASTDLKEKLHQCRQCLIKFQPASHQIAVTTCVISNSGEFLVLGFLDGSILVYDMTKGGFEEEQLSSISLGADNSENLTKNKARRKIYLHRKRVNKIVSLCGNENLFLSCDIEGVTALWHGLTGRLISKFKVRNTNCADIASCSAPDGINNGAMFLSAHSDGAARLWSLDRPNYLRLLVHEFGVNLVSLRQMIGATVTDTENLVRIWDLNTGSVLRVLEQMEVRCLKLHLVDNRRICAISETGIFQLSDINSATTPTKQKLDMPAGGQITNLISISSNTSLLLGSNKSKLFSVEFSEKADSDPVLSISSISFQENSLDNCPVVALKWKEQSNRIFIVLTE